MRALVIDDSDTIRRIVRQTLEARLGLAVTEAADGDEALALLGADEPFDLLVTDLNMPGVSGAKLVGRLRAAAPEAPVLVVSVEGAVETTVAEILAAGADAFLEKPFALSTLEERVRGLLPRGAAPRT